VEEFLHAGAGRKLGNVTEGPGNPPRGLSSLLEGKAEEEEEEENKRSATD